MKVRKYILALLVGGAASVLLATAGVALAAFPNFSDCPRSNPAIAACVDIQSVTGSLEIKGFTVPLGTSFEIRGGLVPSEGRSTLAAPTGTTGIFAKPVRIPGGILGIEYPIPGNAVTATAQLAGTPSQVVFELGIPVSIVTVPVKLKLDNPILGSNCYIGSNSNPVRLVLTTGTTSPPLPNRPISGNIGTPAFTETLFTLTGAVSVDNSFAVPGATGCGLGLGLVNAIINAKLRLPSAAGNNTMIVTNNAAIGS